MLRITLEQELDLVTLKLEGRLAGPWVDELERSWKNIRETEPGQRVTVNLSEVSFVDPEGEELLRSMFRDGAQLQSGPSVSVTRLILYRIKHASDGTYTSLAGG